MRNRHGASRKAGRGDLGMAAVAALAAAGVGVLAVNLPGHAPAGTGRTAAAAAAAGTVGGAGGVGGSATTDPGWTPTRMAAATPLDSPTLTPTIGGTPSDPAADIMKPTEGLIPADTTTAVPSPSHLVATTKAPASATAASPDAPSTPAAQTAEAPAPEPTERKAAPSAQTFGGVPTVGVLFFTDKSLADHFCTASVVHSPAGDLAITAAHCVYNAGPGGGAKTGLVFVPGYRDGQSPYGQWTPSQVLVAPGWSNSGDVKDDVAFLVLNRSSAGSAVEAVTGADQIAFNQGFGQSVTIPAYPAGAGTPITCTNTTTAASPAQTEFDCGGYPDGTSGAPFLTGVNATGNQGTVIGVIGGFQQGGDTPAISYSSYFGGDIAALYQTAVAAG